MATTTVDPPPLAMRGKRIPASARVPQKRASAGKPAGQAVVGVVGLGIMGSAMAASLMRSDFRVVGYDVLPKVRQQHARAGGVAAADCPAVAREADIIICSLPSSDALLDVAAQLATGGQGLARRSRAAAKAGPRKQKLIIIETSTLPIAVKEQARAILATRGVILLDCPLSGTGAQARTKDLAVYASGDRAAYRRTIPVLEGFARAHYYVGPFGAGSKMKFAANLLVAIHNVAAAEALVLAMKSGLDPAMTLKVLADGGGSSRMLQVRGPMMVKGDYASEVTMKLAVWQKDMTVIADFAKAAGCPTPLFSATAPLYLAATAANPTEDTGAVCAVLEALANYRRPNR
jgi:putative dehydrogenase